MRMFRAGVTTPTVYTLWVRCGYSTHMNKDEQAEFTRTAAALVAANPELADEPGCVCPAEAWDSCGDGPCRTVGEPVSVRLTDAERELLPVYARDVLVWGAVEQILAARLAVPVVPAQRENDESPATNR